MKDMETDTSNEMIRNVPMTYMHPPYGISLTLFVLLCSFWAASNHASSQLEAVLRKSDGLFNSADYQGARTNYERALQQAKLNGRKDLEGELLNNIAAVHMATRNYNLFRQYFHRAKQAKLSQIAAKSLTPEKQAPRANLLTNGGFEDGIVYPWGTGHYERAGGKFGFGLWWNSANAKAFMKADRDVLHSGKRSLRITNYSPSKPHVFTTLSQRISGLQPNTVYNISFYAKTNNLKRGAVTFSIDAAWTKRLLTLSVGSHDWKLYKGTINIGHNDYIDFRIIQQNTGTVWLDDIVISKSGDNGANDLLQQAESLFDRADYNKALDVYNAIEDNYTGKRARLPATIKLMRGRIYKVQGKYNLALDEFNQLTEEGLPLAHIDAGELYFTLGDHERAERHYNKALLAFAGDQGTYALILNKLADNYRAQGKLDKSLQAQKRSHRILSHIDDKHGQALSQHSLGITYSLLKDYPRSFSNFSNASKLVAQLDDKKLLSEILNSHAYSAYQAGKISIAVALLNRSLTIKRKIKDNAGLIQALHLNGRILIARNDTESALGSYREAVGLLEKLLGGLGAVPKQTRSTYLGQFSDLYREYINLLFKLHTGNMNKGYDKEAFSAVEQVRSRIFSEMINETRASRIFSANTKDIKFAKLLARERHALLKIQSTHRTRNRLLYGKEDKQDKKGILAIDKRLAEVENNYRVIQTELARKYPRYMDLKKPKRLEIEDVKGLLGKDDVILSYFVTPQHIGIWAIDQNSARLAVSDSGRQVLAKSTLGIRGMANAVLNLFSRLGANTDRKEVERAFGRYDVSTASQLFKELIGPHKSLLRNKKTLYIVPDDILYKIPFEALLTDRFTPEKGGIVAASLKNAPFLVNKYDIVYLPSISVLRSLHELAKTRPSGQKPLIAFADPVFNGTSMKEAGSVTQRGQLVNRLSRSGAIRGSDLPQLPETRDEALFVANLLQAQKKDLYLGIRASESNVKKLPLNQFNNVLFATHGFLAGEFKPGVQPALALSFVGDPANDGLLEMSEILGLNMSANLVVLSACNTASGSGKNDHGEGFAGLTRSFMYAGARSLFVTLWSVESSTAKTLMQSTFKRIASLGKSGSLASAKRSMIVSSEKLKLLGALSVSTAHPYFWAPYILVGEAHDH